MTYYLDIWQTDSFRPYLSQNSKLTHTVLFSIHNTQPVAYVGLLSDQGDLFPAHWVEFTVDKITYVYTPTITTTTTATTAAAIIPV